MSQAHTTGKVLASTVGAVGLLLATGQAANAASITVKANDTVWGLAQQHGVSVKSIEKLNQIKASDVNVDLIYVGQNLQISGSTTKTTTTKSATKKAAVKGTYTVKAGDTLWALADQYNTSVHALQTLNGLSSDLIVVGQNIQVPGATTKATAKTSQAATTTTNAVSATSATTKTATVASASSTSSTSASSVSSVSASDTSSTSTASQDAVSASTSSTTSSTTSTTSAASSTASSTAAVTVKAVATSASASLPTSTATSAAASSSTTSSSTANSQATSTATSSSVTSSVTSAASSTATSQSDTTTTSASSTTTTSSASQSSTTLTSSASQSSSTATSASTTSQSSSAAATSSASSSASNAATTNSSSTTTSSTSDLATGSVTGLALKLASANIPYVWGGASLSGMDCSGLVSYVYQHAAGITLPHSTVAQEAYVTTHSVADAQPGDILFWGSRGSTYHDAIYIGNNQYVAAPTEGKNVQVQTISSYFMPSFAGTVK
ncbi:C40 family peptidase [Lactiplantibacillus paraplantarum]|uniref:LysM peptidoglycan-binding domain-containing protein n=1 Tax=Lactiplantibacillus paraplantarum TaxID=60520 RepID=A0AAD0X8E7_9LACO|nr:C40 family peptidase [Lactiplantibacillus paraplantarum]AVW10674.1 LysM peptidoglycan-binding domain-containing protein [Lactiplantibacillus paraplantarum]AYJ39024.1 LysM peptidoglycan-binding domain-containing protein [Lactiplantibacillus paraplantarum]ERL43539.1 putative extracellular protein, gamma-D-glutamate-meso-diaminopimelate muropeptidase (putative) [Lactiplantibacillus paraplantarum]KRL49374.1 extracellular protein, gamma-D-glutamate-meso-diaminopimelate muropeptidase [Lactiplantib